MKIQAMKINTWGKNIYVKVPVANSKGKFMSRIIRELNNENIKINKKNDMVNFKDFFRNSSVFIIDDIQFVSGKESLQEEFFHTFNSLIDKGSQIVISADRAPMNLDRVQDRINSRLAGGLVVDIDTPDLELTIRIIKKKIQLRAMIA